jgi:hypothetical protein
VVSRYGTSGVIAEDESPELLATDPGRRHSGRQRFGLASRSTGGRRSCGTDPQCGRRGTAASRPWFPDVDECGQQVCDYSVDQVRGAPGNPGTQDKPWETVNQAIAYIQATAPAQGAGKAICVYAEQPEGEPAPTTYTAPG